MRIRFGLAASIAILFLPMSAALQNGAQAQIADPAAQPSPEAKDADAKDTRISLEDLRQLRGKKTPPSKVAETIAEEGRAFEVTADIDRELRKLGFSPAQVAAIKAASTDPIVPGKHLPYTEGQRDAIMEMMRRVTAKSRADIEPVASRHITLWAAKDDQKTYVADLKAAERFLHTKCAEPLRAGTEPRTAHVVLLSNHSDYEAWWRAMLDLYPERYEQKNNPGFNDQIRRTLLRGPAVFHEQVAVACVAEVPPPLIPHLIAYDAGLECAGQLVTRMDRPLEMAFANVVEAEVCGWPGVTGSQMVYGKEAPAGELADAWSRLVRQRFSARKATPLSDLLKTDLPETMAVNAERWTLIALLNQQPVKFGKLLLALKESDTDLAAIEKVYGWNEKELTMQWRMCVAKLANKKAAGNRN